VSLLFYTSNVVVLPCLSLSPSALPPLIAHACESRDREAWASLEKEISRPEHRHVLQVLDLNSSSAGSKAAMASRSHLSSPPTAPSSVEHWAQSSAKGRTRFDLPPETSPSPAGAGSSHRSASPATGQRQAKRPPQASDPPLNAPHKYTSSRDSYPTFLPLADTFKLQLGWALRGLVDAFRWDIVVKLLARCAALHHAPSITRKICTPFNDFT